MKFPALDFKTFSRFYGIAVLVFFAQNLFSQSTGCASITGYGDTTVCGTDVAVQLNASPGFVSYSWSPANGLSDTTIANPMALVSISAAYVVTGSAISANLLANGDFSLGNTGFSSGLNYMPTYSPGNYFVGPGFFDLSLSYDFDHTLTSDNYFMSVDGGTSLVPLWETTVTVTPGEDYKFDFWCIRVDAVQPIFEIHFIGDVTGDVVVANVTALPYAGVWTWDQYGAPLWNAGSNNSLTIRIVNLELDGYGNDFALDDMTLVGPCYSTDTVYIAAGSQPEPPLVADTSFCAFNGVYVPQAAGQNVLWYEGFPGSGDLNAPAVDGTEVGTHVFWATQNNGLCQSDTSRLTLVINEWPFFELPDTLVLCEGDLFTVGPTAVPEWNYMWSDGQTITPRAVSSAGIYWLEAVNNCGGHTDSTLVVIDDCMCYFYMPNAITPNGDGSNEVFKPVYDCSMENYQLLVFNRWGQVVFETTDPYQEWNATDQGFGLVQDGVYVWSVQFTETETGETVRHTGHVVVLR